MKVQIKRNYITQGGHLYGPGDEIEMAEQAVERFFEDGAGGSRSFPEGCIH